MKVLVFGAGQLAQMMYLHATPLGVTVQAVDVANETVVHPVSKEQLNVSLDDALSSATAITAEFEHIPEHLLAQAEKTNKLFPNMASILVGADRVREKRLLDKIGAPNCPHIIIDCLEKLDNVVATLGERVIFKASRDGYDGYGQWRMSSKSELAELRSEFAQLDLGAVPLVAEKMLDFNREVSIIGARDLKGNTRCFPIAENLHFEGQLHLSIAPATDLDEATQQQANRIFEQIADELDYVGILAVELFDIDGELLVNEIAPRVHNSGHWTQAGADISQFEQHIRAILSLPLGSVQATPKTAMVNIIGCTDINQNLLAIPQSQFHWYGKQLKKKRKMGHINISASSYQQLGEKLATLRNHLPEEFFPLLQQESSRLSLRGD